MQGAEEGHLTDHSWIRYFFFGLFFFPFAFLAMFASSTTLYIDIYI